VDGYYRRGDPLGAGGDFTTAPEISQMFGELIGLWCVEGWRAAGAPAPFALVELGPGRGTLMADALRAARVDPRFGASAALHLVETSRPLRERQRATLAAASPAWHDDLDAVPDLPVVLVANEFLDALPVRQFARTSAGWRERCVGLDGDGGFAFVLADAPPPASALPAIAGEPALGAIVERRPAAEMIAAAIGRRVAARGGCALLIDYGHGGGVGDTLQALAGGRRSMPLESPGTADLTAHVDFAAVAAAARATGAAAWGPATQCHLLRALGIETRAERLAAARPDRRAEIGAALHRLIAVGEMGTLFRALAITRADAPAPAGFADRSDSGER
ncbi:MAG: class I SAM-dependent methyltransferase, partial [Alphaproteobacteria bacterium]